MSFDLQTIRRTLDEERFETTRRMALAALRQPSAAAPRQDLLFLLHEASRALGDLHGARDTLAVIEPRDTAERLRVKLLLAEDYYLMSHYSFFRNSPEEARGLTSDEFADIYNNLADETFDEAVEIAVGDPAARKQIADVMRRCKRQEEAVALSPPCPVPAPPPASTSPATGSLSGQINHADGSPVAMARVTLGFPEEITSPAPATYLGRDMDVRPVFEGPQEIRETTTDADGRYQFDNLPVGTYPFVAVTLPPDEYDVALRFLGRDVAVAADNTATCNATISDWVSAPRLPLEHAFDTQFSFNGSMLQRVSLHELRNPFYFDFPHQFVSLPLPDDIEADDNLLVFLSDKPTEPVPVQLLTDGTLGCLIDLPARTSCVLAIYRTPADIPSVKPIHSLCLTPSPDGQTAEIDTGTVQFRIPWQTGTDNLPPLLAVRGTDQVWRGEGRLLLPEGETTTVRTITLLEQGSLQLRLLISYKLSDNAEVSFEITAHAGESYLLVRETTLPREGMAFKFSLREFSGGRGFLHWTPEQGNLHWTTLKAEVQEIARLQESVAWWIPPQGFGYAMTPDSIEQQDYIGVFTIHRGEWIDREFERISQGPGDDNRELDWPYPEMVGSTISMITAHTTADGDTCFRFGGFDGQRQWGLLVSSLQENDGPYKQISAVQHKVSSPRLQDFIHWKLHDADTLQRPSLLVAADEVCKLRRKKEHPAFAPIWQNLTREHRRGPARGMQALLDSDAALAWRLSREMVLHAPLRARMTLLGRDYADVYSPVGGRGITPFAEQYDLIAATGVFTAEEERDVRAMLLLMGHLFMAEDFMNWRFNSRNANFEADRVDIVGGVGLVFRGNPDADEMIRHCVDLMERSLNVYCTPGSGKWYENPPCYYLHSVGCRMNLAAHLHRHDLFDTTTIPRLKDFLGWAPLLLTGRYPHDYNLMRNGCSYEDYAKAEKVRRIPPIGDHAKLGQWIGEIFALMGKSYEERDPEFANFLRWAYQEGGSHGGHYSKFPLYFTGVTEEELQPAAPVQLESRRLEGFGAIFRGNFGQPDEFYLLFKQGPGGYRYHRTEGSFIMMAQGRPLIWDGGEAGEAWRHSTLSFYDTHMPLAPGRVERFASHSTADFVQGLHPKALSPGEPVFLSDSCEHQLVDVAWERYHEPNPAVLRSLLWVKDEYVVVSDDLQLPADLLTHWHLQAVGDSHTGTCLSPEGLVVKGRFGVDLQVMLPDLPADAVEEVSQIACVEYYLKPSESFQMRHIQLSMQSPRQLTAVLRPLAPGADILTSEPFQGGVHVRGPDIDDTIFFARESTRCEIGDVFFEGRYAAVLRRPTSTTLLLFEGRELRCGSARLTTPGEKQI